MGRAEAQVELGSGRAGRFVCRLESQILGLSGWRRRLTAVLAGAASVLAMAPFFVWPVLVVTLAVLVWLIDRDPRPRAAAAIGWLFGFGYFLAGLFWIGEAFLVEAEVFAWLLPFAVTLMPAGLALFWAGAAAAAVVAWRSGAPRLVALALALALAEWLRGHVLTGLPWNVIGYALTAPAALMQSAALIGVYGLSLVAVLILAAPLVLLADREQDRIGSGLCTGLLVGAATVLTAAFAWGHSRLAAPPPPDHPGAVLRLVQPSIPQREKWRPENQERIFALHLEMSRQNADGVSDELAGVTAVVWPEAAMPFAPLSHPAALARIGAALPAGVHLISGAIRVEPAHGDMPWPQRQVFNSLLVLGAGGLLVALYDKIHLVPFGEYLPFQTWLEAVGLQQLTKLRGGFKAGPAPRPLLDVPGLPKVGPLICYEAIFPAAIVQGRERPGLLVNITNDGWFGNTTGPRQHLHQARVRAVEEGIPIVRVANNGISAMIDARGAVRARLELDVKGVVDTPVPGALPPPLYARHGNLGFWVLMVAAAAALAALLWAPALSSTDRSEL